MRKLMLFVCSICICILSSFSSVYASDSFVDDYDLYGSFNGVEYPIFMIDPNISLFREVDGFEVRAWYTKSSDGDFIEFSDTNVSGLNTSTYYDFMYEIYLPSTIEHGSTFSYDIDYRFAGLSSILSVDVSFINVIDGVPTNKFTSFITSYSVSGDLIKFNRDTFSVDHNFNCIRFYFNNVKPGSSQMWLYVKNLYFSEVSDNSLLGGILSVVKNVYSSVVSLPSKIADSISKFFYSDDPIINESETSNNELSNSINNYNDIESGLTDNLQNNINNLDTTVDLFNVSDFNATSIFLSQQLTNIFNINENIRNMIMYSLIMGFSLVLIGIGVKR